MDQDEEQERAKRMFRSGFGHWLDSLDTDLLFTSIGIVIALLTVMMLFAALFPSGPAARAHAKKLLESHGYQQIELDSAGWFDCGRDDINNESCAFRALTPNGMRVEGTVCCGWTKDCTIRFK